MKRVIIIIVALLTVSKAYSQNKTIFEEAFDRAKNRNEEVERHKIDEKTEYYLRRAYNMPMNEKDSAYMLRIEEERRIEREQYMEEWRNKIERRIKSLEWELEELNKKLSNSYIASDAEAKNKIRKEIGDKKIELYEAVEIHIGALKESNMYDETWRKKYEKYGF